MSCGRMRSPPIRRHLDRQIMYDEQHARIRRAIFRPKNRRQRPEICAGTPTMDATAWTVIGTAATILIAIGVSFRSLRADINDVRKNTADQEKSLRRTIEAQGAEVRELGERIEAQGTGLRERIEAQGTELRAELRKQIETQGAELRERIEAQGTELREQGAELRKQIETQGAELREHIEAQGTELREHIGQLRERMAHLEGLLEGLREAITRRAA